MYCELEALAPIKEALALETHFAAAYCSDLVVSAVGNRQEALAEFVKLKQKGECGDKCETAWARHKELQEAKLEKYNRKLPTEAAVREATKGWPLAAIREMQRRSVQDTKGIIQSGLTDHERARLFMYEGGHQDAKPVSRSIATLGTTVFSNPLFIVSAMASGIGFVSVVAEKG